MNSTHLAAPVATRNDDATELPAVRAVVVTVDGGFDDAVRVAMMLRGRGYRIRSLSLDVREGAAPSTLHLTVDLTGAETALLVLRLDRLPAVVAADALCGP